MMKKKDIQHELIPVPRNLSTDCGMCIRLQADYYDVKADMEGIKIYQCYSVEGTTFTAVIP